MDSSPPTQNKPLTIASWNVGHRLGRGAFRREIVEAIPALDADIVCLNEYYPREHDAAVRSALELAGFDVHVSGPATTVANLTLIASRIPLERCPFDIEYFDEQLPSNTLPVHVPQFDLTIIAVRIPMYAKAKAPLMLKAWDVLEVALTRLRDRRVIVIGDLNCSLEHRRPAGRTHLARLFANGWHQAGCPGTRTFFSTTGSSSWVDHLLHTRSVQVETFEALTAAGKHALAQGSSALSDHAAIRAKLFV